MKSAKSVFSLFSSSINCVAPILLDSEISTYRSNSTKYAVSHNCSHVVQKLQRCCPGIHASCNDKFNRRVITGFQLENEQWYQPQFHQSTEKLLIKFIKRVAFFALLLVSFNKPWVNHLFLTFDIALKIVCVGLKLFIYLFFVCITGDTGVGDTLRRLLNSPYI